MYDNIESELREEIAEGESMLEHYPESAAYVLSSLIKLRAKLIQVLEEKYPVR